MSIEQDLETSRFQTMLPALRDWLDSEWGQHLMTLERDQLCEVLSHTFGHHACTLGIVPDSSLLELSRISNCVFLTPLEERSGRFTVRIIENMWGIQPRSMNLVLLQHALEFADRPHRVLREACRAICAGGKLVVVGFNPYSFWNLNRTLAMGENSIMREASFYSASRLQDWLTLLNFRITEVHFSGGLFPLKWSPSLAHQHKLVQKLSVGNFGLGSFYTLVAVKERAGLIPFDHRWRSSGNRLLAGY